MICLGHNNFRDDSKENETMMETQAHFQRLRLGKSNAPDPSPIQDEILVILKMALEKVVKPVKVLSKMGVIILEKDKIAINISILHHFLSSCKSRLNNVLKRDKWDIIQLDVNEKTEILQPLIDRKKVRNWTIRILPSDSLIAEFVSLHINELIFLKSDENDFVENPNERTIHNPNTPQVRQILDMSGGNNIDKDITNEKTIHLLP